MRHAALYWLQVQAREAITIAMGWKDGAEDLRSLSKQQLEARRHNALAEAAKQLRKAEDAHRELTRR